LAISPTRVVSVTYERQISAPQASGQSTAKKKKKRKEKKKRKWQQAQVQFAAAIFMCLLSKLVLD
jgi:hypothetical protein